MNRPACLFALLLPVAALAADPPKPTVVVKDLKNPTAVCATTDGRVFVVTGATVLEVSGGQAETFAELPGKDVCSGLIPFQRWLYAVRLDGSVQRVDLGTKKVDEWVTRADLPKGASVATGLTADERGGLYLTDMGDGKNGGVVVSVGTKFGPRGPTRGDVKQVSDGKGLGAIGYPRAVLSDGLNHALVLGADGALVRLNVSTGGVEPVADGLKGVAGLCGDTHGRLFVLGQDAIWGLPQQGTKPVRVLEGLTSTGANKIAFDPVTRRLLFTGKDSLLAVPAVIPGWEVDESPLPVETAPAFADVKWTGWDDGSSSGKVVPFRPIVLTHANDGSGRTFVATQHGVIHAIEKGANESKLFLDLQSKVLYRDDQNEQGLLGLAFHPDYKKTGEFFVFYTDKAKKLENVVCRFKVSKDDPNKADPASEQELLRISHKYWNHDGGTLVFGPDGFLYVVLGDGGSANDPDDHGQKTDVLLGKILRVDINAKGDTTPYAIPKDNPFVGKKEYRPEIFALGVRNPWRMSFDRKTGQGWFGEVGQNLWEEVNLLEKGANYGWRRRESLHPFGADGTGPKNEFTDPIWEYHHEVGKSITGGHVYRGKEVPALDGHYLYADYVSTKVWALKYDDKAKRVTANRPVAAPKLAWMSFGEDETGEVYLMTYAANGKGIYKFKAGK